MFKVFTQKRKRTLSTPRIVAISAGAHLLLLNAALLMSHTPPEPAAPEETYDEWNIARPTPPTPRPPPPADPVETVRPVAGKTLRLQAPTTVPDRIPDVDPTEKPASAEHYSGEGREGDVIGEPSPTPAPPTGVTQGDPGVPATPDFGDYVYESAEVMPEIANGRDVARLLERNYPEAMLSAGVGARVTLEMVVDEKGRVRPGSVRVVATTHEEFSLASVRVAERFRFRPALVGDRAVPILVTLPIEWKPEQR